MRRSPAVPLALVLGLVACGGPAAPPSNGVSELQRFAINEVRLKAADGLTIYATETVATHPKAIILLFHQAGSSRGEYAPIVRPLAEAGYSSLAIDQRSGGDMYGPNMTVHAAQATAGTDARCAATARRRRRRPPTRTW